MRYSALIAGLGKIRGTSPLIVNLTNYVAMTPSANALLAIGASPLMSSCVQEMDELVHAASAVLVNIGCIEERQLEAMTVAVRSAASEGKPWVLDPVGAGISGYRLDSSKLLLGMNPPAAVRGNAAEICALASGRLDSSHSRGVDSLIGSGEAQDCALSLARQYGTVVCVGGAEDFITDGTRSVALSGGSVLMTRVTAMGCISSAIVAAFCAVSDDFFDACCSASRLVSAAAGEASLKSDGTASFAIAFIDELSRL